MHNQNIKRAFEPNGVDIFLSPWPADHGATFVFDAPEFSLINQLLDVGGGPGMMASLLKRFQPQLKITVFDRAALCEEALELFRATAQQDDLGAHAGDILLDPFPSGFEAIRLAGIVENLAAVQVKSLLRKTFAALPRGGLLLIYARMAGDGLAAPVAAPNTPPRAVSQYREWLQASGFTPMACRRYTTSHVLLSAVK